MLFIFIQFTLFFLLFCFRFGLHFVHNKATTKVMVIRDPQRHMLLDLILLFKHNFPFQNWLGKSGDEFRLTLQRTGVHPDESSFR